MMLAGFVFGQNLYLVGSSAYNWATFDHRQGSECNPFRIFIIDYQCAHPKLNSIYLHEPMNDKHFEPKLFPDTLSKCFIISGFASWRSFS